MSHPSDIMAIYTSRELDALLNQKIEWTNYNNNPNVKGVFCMECATKDAEQFVKNYSAGKLVGYYCRRCYLRINLKRRKRKAMPKCPCPTHFILAK